MTSNETIQTFVVEMLSTNKRNEKKATLKKWQNNQTVYQLLNTVYNPYLTFGVTGAGVAAYYKRGQFAPCPKVYAELTPLLEALASRELSGNAALSACVHFMIANAHVMEESTMLSIFDKDMKLGVDAKTINECWDNCIPVYDVALAFDWNKSPKYKERVESERYLMLQKLDGVRAVGEWRGGVLTFRSRTGQEFTTLDKLKDDLVSTVLKDMDDCVFDGELCVLREDGSEDFIQAVSEVKRKNFTMERPHYKIFDFLTMKEFQGVEQSDSYAVRLRRAMSIINRNGTKLSKTAFASVLPAVWYSPDNYARAAEIVALKGWEGLILRADKPYTAGRTSDLLKVKLMHTDEFKILRLNPTKKLMLGLDGTTEFVDCVGSITIAIPGGTCDVGSGFSDAQRVHMFCNPTAYIGHMASVKYFEKTQDKQGNPSLRFPIFLQFRDVID